MRTVLVVALAAAACDGLGPVEFRVPGRIFDDPPDEPGLSSPDTVAAEQPFEVTVFTAGGGCWRMGDTEVALFGDSAVVAPFDIRIFHRDPDILCPGFLAIHEHVATISFPRPGQGLVIVRGIAFGSSTPIVLRKTIVVE